MEFYWQLKNEQKKMSLNINEIFLQGCHGKKLHTFNVTFFIPFINLLKNIKKSDV